MKALLDTHTLVWFAFADPKLSNTARLIIEDRMNQIFVSPASYWEIAIKVSLGKWQLQQPYQVLMDSLWDVYGFNIMPIEPSHTAALIQLPQVTKHRDPFDRLLAAQALVEQVPIISADAKFDQYGVTRLWT